SSGASWTRTIAPSKNPALRAMNSGSYAFARNICAFRPCWRISRASVSMPFASMQRRDEVDLRVAHLLHVRAEVRDAEREALVGEDDLRRALVPLEARLDHVEAVRGLRHAVGEDGDARLVEAVRDRRPRRARAVDAEAERTRVAEEVGGTGPLVLDVPAERRHTGLREQVGPREQHR